MADPPPYPGTPRWVKVFGIIAIVVLVLVVVIVTFGPGPGGGHGPGRHTPSGGAGGQLPPSSFTENHAPSGGDGGGTPPEGGH
jgi:hypothetical protein